jgi:hypothetical protein
MKAKATHSFAQDRGTGATPASGAKAGATQSTFTASDAIPWKPVDPKHPGLEMFAVGGNPNEGASLILQKFPAGPSTSLRLRHCASLSPRRRPFSSHSAGPLPRHSSATLSAITNRILGQSPKRPSGAAYEQSCLHFEVKHRTQTWAVTDRSFAGRASVGRL